jgi:6,7-dimethyl-8-ribityllumazine synthase
MSRAAPSRPKIASGKRTFYIVASRFNVRYVDGLVDHVMKEVRALVPTAAIAVHRVPGAFEVPVVVQELADRRKVDAIIACSVILKGETDHAENLSRSVTDALQQIAVEHAVPVINVVLGFDDADQARARCLEDKINRGTEAARAAVEISNVMSELRGSGGAAALQPRKDSGRLERRRSGKQHVRKQRKSRSHG